jgi:competence protein ComEA
MPDLSLSRRNALLLVAALAVVLLGASRLFGSSASKSAPLPREPVVPAATVSPAVGSAAGSELGRAVVIDVVGAVRRPGLYHLTQGARVADALARAGGATRKADLAAVNLAAPVADGEQVVVPRRGAAGAVAAPGAAATAGAPQGPVHLNTATLEQLDGLPGVGPVTAQKILDYRTKHGAFHSVDELDAVSGIGPARLDSLRDLVAP